MKILVIDVGGTHIKILATGETEPLKIPSGPDMTPQKMVEDVTEAAADWAYEAVSIGYPGFVFHGKLVCDPFNLAPGWVGFDFETAFGRPVKLINDAAMQALGSYEGGRMLFLGLGTGLGSAVILNGELEPLELAHLPYRKHRTFEDYLGERGLKKLGRKKWEEHVHDVVAQMKEFFAVDYVVIGGGNVRKIHELPEGARRGDNANAFTGGFRLWEPATAPPAKARRKKSRTV
jgi:polyphosphate glucokinase